MLAFWRRSGGKQRRGKLSGGKREAPEAVGLGKLPLGLEEHVLPKPQIEILVIQKSPNSGASVAILIKQIISRRNG